MDKNVLLIFEDMDEAENVADILEDELQNTVGNINAKIKRTEADAVTQLERKNFDLIIVDLRIPAAKKSREVNRGLAFLKNLAAADKQIPSILVSPVQSNKLLDETYDLYKCRLVALGEGFESGLTKACQSLLTPEKAAIAENSKNAVIDIRLDMDRNDWNFVMEGRFDDHNYQVEGILEIDREKIEALIDDSKDMGTIKEWEKRLKRIGKGLVEEIFRNNYMFAKHFHRLESKIGDHKNIIFRFNVKKNVYPLLLEAMFEEDELDDQAYWMLKSPIYRKLPVFGEYHKLTFNKKDWPQKINCLIIKSDVSGFVPKLEKSFQKLENISIESEELYRYLNSNRQHCNVDLVEVIETADDLPNFTDFVKDKLKNCIWHLVHFAGHSYYDHDTQKGYVIFPGEDYPGAVDIKEFSQWLRSSKTQLIFLSSCHSSEEYFVFELANSGIPAIIGFRWDLDDELAAEYAIKFYQHLFKDKNILEHAFLQTRKDMYNEHGGDPIWASPMLIMQS